ncbi:transcription factor divaricata [Phtheirospermum japonicum]|uniref:Transcription factor divaricata n=1 Tax=Phtheirospermum japonicum TaxID=374723 RepID=A0A830BWK8_9LAMI|nr:transcription factor divaricata [Phtheirospermum japonicum]
MDDVRGRWTWQEDKQFENGLVEFPEDCPNRWERIAARLGTRSAAEVEWHYAVLLADVEAIEAGLIEPPEYREAPKQHARKAGRPWTAEEHELFLKGLKQYGKGDWKSISRKAVLTRSPTQVASHAQKYYLRLQKEEEQRKRKSIFDIKP